MKHPTSSKMDPVAILTRVQQLLDNAQQEVALEILAESGQKSPVM